MAYKSILSVLTDSSLSENVIAHASAITEFIDAHLDLLCLGVDRSQTGYYYAGANAMVLQETINRAQEEAQSLEEKAKTLLAGSNIRWATDAGVSQLADLGRHVAARARFSDLCVLPKPYGKSHGAEIEPIVEAALFEGQCPVLVVPDEGKPRPKPKRIMIGWNESSEALAAVKAAMPVLQYADTVHVVVIDPPTHGPSRSDPGGLLSQYLSRHGVRSEIDVLSKTLPRVSDVLIRHATDMDADLIVMGAYGHSRFREAILGGATRYMLEQAQLPVFMAH
ncbi:MAG: universal stress protein [Rhodobacterales bacterium]|nr:MAG: universal stress protein [Pseudomonadota bacterium]PIE10681.1 MAG: universal stress protein [Rhodobacterales bacterium]